MFQPNKSFVWAIYLALTSLFVGFSILPLRWTEGVTAIGLTNQILLVTAPPLIFIALYYLAYLKKNWARIILLIIIGLSMPGYIMSLYGANSLIFQVTQFPQMVLYAGSFVMFLIKESRQWHSDAV